MVKIMLFNINEEGKNEKENNWNIYLYAVDCNYATYSHNGWK